MLRLRHQATAPVCPAGRRPAPSCLKTPNTNIEKEALRAGTLEFSLLIWPVSDASTAVSIYLFVRTTEPVSNFALITGLILLPVQLGTPANPVTVTVQANGR